jgi:glycosyltransferase involved in cell wall biosynthesis
MKTFIVVPVYNEGARAVDTIKSILKNTKNQLIVVDDGSTDTSFRLINTTFKKNVRVSVLRHLVNLGKGAAMKTGIEMAWKKGGEAVIFLDADGQHNPKFIGDFERWLKDYPIVFGYREMNRNMPIVRRWGNKFSIVLVRLLFNVKKKDLLSGYLGFRREVYEDIKWLSPRYGIETEMATKIGRNNIPFKEIKIDTIYIDKYKGVSILDALKILCQIPFWYFSK